MEHIEAREDKTLRCSASPAADFRRVFSGFLSWISESRFRRSDLFAVAVYGAVIWFGALYHEPWVDEALPWMIARDSGWRDFFRIIFENWDRHPGLFHSILIPFAKLGFPYFTQTCLNATFAIAAAVLFIWKAPFPRIFRYLFLISYYMIYEYSVVVRPYMLAVMLIFVIAAFYPRRNRNPVTYALLIALLLHADYISFGLSAGLIVAYAIENFSLLKTGWRSRAALFLMTANLLLVLWMAHTLPAGHQEYDRHIPVRLTSLIIPVTNAFYPFSDLGYFMNVMPFLAAISGLLILASVFLSLRKKPIPATILGFGLAHLLLVFLFFHKGDYRHYGFILINVLFVLWIADDHAAGDGSRVEASRALSLALLLIAACWAFGVTNVWFVYLQEYFLFFSGAKPMAAAIREIDKKHGIFKNGFVVIAKHRSSAGLLPYLPGVKFWNPCTKSYAAYYLATKELTACDDMAPREALENAKRYFGDLQKTLLLFERPLPVPGDQDYYYQKLFAAERGIFGYNFEKFYLYRPLPMGQLKAAYDETQRRQSAPGSPVSTT